jgi:hypothetical protein
MKSYPSIPAKINKEIPIYAFDKLDGSNIRAEWTKKNGFNKFGSRNRLLGEDQGLIFNAKELILEKYADDLAEIFKKQKYQKAICFFEFFGPKSFAGNLVEGDKHDVVLFDVNPFKKGIIGPAEFIKTYGHLDIPKLLYTGKANQDFYDSVRKSTLEGMTDEGVVCKGMKSNQTLMFKIKSERWLHRLMDYCSCDIGKFNRLK